MQVVSPRYQLPSGRHAIIDALTSEVRLWLADILAEPIPEELVAILRQMEITGPDDDLRARRDRPDCGE